MEPIYSRDAQVVGWFKDNVIYDLDGKHLAFVRNESLFSYSPTYLGRLAHGFFRDLSGHAVAFMRGASGGPITPALRVVPKPPSPWPPVATPDVRVAPKAASPSIFWSELEFAALFEPVPETPREPILGEEQLGP